MRPKERYRDICVSISQITKSEPGGGGGKVLSYREQECKLVGQALGLKCVWRMAAVPFS